MILTVNLGNTHITIGGYEHDDLKFCGRLHTDPAATVDEYGLRLLNLLSLHGASPEQIEGGILGAAGAAAHPDRAPRGPRTPRGTARGSRSESVPEGHAW